MFGRFFGRMKPNVAMYQFPKDQSVLRDLHEKYAASGDLLNLFALNDGPHVHKWHHYLPLYQQYFAPYRNKPIRFLEIGVSKGGSLRMWRRYFGESAVIYGIDIDPDCAQHDGADAKVRIGSQDDPAFLNQVLDEMGGVDVVLDDGSHHMDHVRASLLTIFPRMTLGGTYMIEDMHTAYWERFGGGYRSPSNAFQMVREIADDVHHWYHRRPHVYPALRDMIGGIHLHDSIVVLDKATVHRPAHSWIGQGSPYLKPQPSEHEGDASAGERK